MSFGSQYLNLTMYSTKWDITGFQIGLTEKLTPVQPFEIAMISKYVKCFIVKQIRFDMFNRHRHLQKFTKPNENSS